MSEIPKNLPSVDAKDRTNVGDMLEILNADPDYHYRFIRDDRMRLSRARLQGYEPVEEGSIELLMQGSGAADGTIRVGDTILMACPRERYEKRRKRSQDLSEARLSAPKEQAIEKAERLAHKHQLKGKVQIITDKEG